MKTPTSALAAALLAAASLAGCANNLQPQLQSQTALALGGGVSPAQITISDVNTGTACFLECPLTWRAAAPSGNFACTDEASGKDGTGPHQTVCVKRK